MIFETLIVLIIVAVVGAVVIHFLARTLPPSEARWLVRVLLAALALRLAAATMFALFPSTRVFHEDADGYEYVGMQIALHWRGLRPPFLLAEALTTNYGYYYVSAAIYFIVGAVPAAVSYVNAVVGTVSIFLVYRLARQFFHLIVARRAAQLTAFFPSMILWSAIALKDPVTVLLVLCAISGVVSLKRKFTIGALFMTVGPMLAVQPIRFYMLYFLILAAGASLLFERGSKVLTGVSKQIVLVLGVVAVLAVTGLAGRAREDTEFLSLQKVSRFRAGMATTANSGFDADVDISTPGRAILFLPIGVANLLWSPFPWQLGSMRAAFALPEMLIWWAMFPALIRGIRFSIKRKLAETSPLLVFSFAMTFAYSLVHGNIGSGFRERAQIFVFLFIFAALGAYQKRCRRRGIDERLLLQSVDAAGPGVQASQGLAAAASS